MKNKGLFLRNESLGLTVTFRVSLWEKKKDLRLGELYLRQISKLEP